ncbi:hypothetical protein GCM10022235_81940 [Kribbella ginsengisoli]|uniref:Uncharacterized protein n=1 Tax=Kribbella ginsengisoli TaxID=363865 RepID=A0ABP6Z4G0_9ACTN
MAVAGSGFAGFADEAFALDADDGVGDVDGAGLEVDLGPEDGEGFADADAGAEHEGDQVGEVGSDGCLVGCQVFAEEGDLFGLDGSGWFLGGVFDAFDFADRVDGDGAVADGELHQAGDDGSAGFGCWWAGVLLDLGDDGVDAGCGCFADAEFAEGGADVVLEGAEVGVQRGGGAGAVGDLLLELGDPKVDEVVDLVHRRELAALAGLGAILELLEQGALGGCRGFGVGRHVADLAVMVAEVGLRADADRLTLRVRSS